jgi:hypothetical protein
MNLLKRIILFPIGPRRNPASELSRIGHEKRRAHVRSVARQMRSELGLPPVSVLET